MPRNYTNPYETSRMRVLEGCIAQLAGAGNEVLELGCNDGTITQRLLEQFPRIVGVDLDARQLGVARDQVGTDRVTWMQHDLDAPLPASFAGQFDVVVALEIIEHLSSPDAFLDEIRRVLRRGKRLLLSTPNLWSPEAVSGAFWARRQGIRYVAWDNTHKTLFNSRQLLALLRRHGFSPRRVVGHHYATTELPLVNKAVVPPFKSSAWWPLNRFGFDLIVDAVRT